MNAKLTDGQQGVIDNYNNEIYHARRERDNAYDAWFTNENAYTSNRDYQDYRHYRDMVEELVAERDAVLENFLAENNPAPVAAPATEPQTAAYQAAVDNVWFENTRNASSIKSSWTFDLWNSRMDRLDYVSNLEEQIIQALRPHRAVDNTRN